MLISSVLYDVMRINLYPPIPNMMPMSSNSSLVNKNVFIDILIFLIKVSLPTSNHGLCPQVRVLGFCLRVCSS